MKTTCTKQCIVADDVRASREILGSWLAEFGYGSVLVGDGEAARLEAERERPDLIITDIEMPRCNGLELLNAIRNHRDSKLRSIPVIVVSSLHDERIVDLVGNFNATCVLSKPLEKLRVKSVLLAIESGEEQTQSLSYVHPPADGAPFPAISPKLRRMVDEVLRSDP
ncbi:MAG: response regulator [Planctomycetaceae bacterium]